MSGVIGGICRVMTRRLAKSTLVSITSVESLANLSEKR